MATIQTRTSKAGKVSHTATIRLKGHKPISATFSRKTECKRWIQETEISIRNGKYFDAPTSHTVADLCDKYIDAISSKPLNHKRQRTTHLLEIKRLIGFMLLSELTPVVIAGIRDDLAKAETPRGIRTPGTVNRYLATLSHALSLAESEWGWVKGNPCRAVRRLPEPRGRTRYLSDAERAKLLSVIKHPGLYLAVVLSLSTGARRGEIMNLQWSDLDIGSAMDNKLSGLMILRQTKNGEIRSIPLSGLAFDLLRGYQPSEPNGLVFPSKVNRNKAVCYEKQWQKALSQANIKGFRWHDLRHSCASYLAMNDASLLEIAEILGHKSIQMTKRYSHLSSAHTEKVLKDMTKNIF